MSDATLETVLKRDRAVVLTAVLVLTALAWIYVLWTAATMSAGTSVSSMPGMDMPGMNMGWTIGGFAFTAAMWVVMMIGMMTPSAAPMILLYARVGRQARAQGKPFAASGWFASGYLLAWSSFSLAATLTQWAIERASLLTPM